MQVFLEPAVDISRITRDACEFVRSSIPENIHVEIQTVNDVPLFETNAAGQVRQLIVNLLMNAAEAIGEEKGIVTVRTAMEPVTPGSQSNVPQWNVLGYELPAGQYVTVEVSDSGPGMDDQMQKQIFDPFFTTKFTGRGLGLAAVQGIVRSMGGAIRLTSAAGMGSTVQGSAAAAGVSVRHNRAGRSASAG